MPKEKSKKDKEILEMAAEQFARLFWKQWLYMREKEKHRSRKKSFLKRRDIDT